MRTAKMRGRGGHIKMEEVILKVGNLIQTLKNLNPEDRVLLACDEEQNTIFGDVRIKEYDGEIVLFGCSGSEVE